MEQDVEVLGEAQVETRVKIPMELQTFFANWRYFRPTQGSRARQKERQHARRTGRRKK